MCGLSGIVAAYDAAAKADLSGLGRALEKLGSFAATTPASASTLEGAVAEAEGPAALALAWSGFRILFADAATRETAGRLATRLADAAEAIDRRLAEGRDSTAAAERLAAAALRARDVAWRLEKDALENLKRVRDLAASPGEPIPDKLLFELWRLNLTFNQLERQEVRGRDSGGLGTIVHLGREAFAAFEADLARVGLTAELARRRTLRDFRDGAILVALGAPAAPTAASAGAPDPATLGRVLGFAHKVAREVGELGANVRALRAGVRADRILQLALARDDARVQPFAHTRWASNGIINEANCHPLTNEVEGGIASAPLGGDRASLVLPRLVLSALNGDIDNYPEILSRQNATGRPIPTGITTDAKVIASEIDRIAAGDRGRDFFVESFGVALQSFEGSTAIAAVGSDAPGLVGLALRGSGQAVYIGLLPAGGGYIFASELYGVVEIADRFYKLNGETERVPGNPLSRGEVALLEEGRAGVTGLQVFRYDGEGVTLAQTDAKWAPITTRDIDRGGFDHYLLKEISESPRSVRKTLRGKFVLETAPGEGARTTARFLVGEDVIPAAVRKALRERSIARIFVIGQGTACVAARAVADFLGTLLPSSGIEVRGLPATELSGFHLERCDAKTLVIAISQSGTTTDTNRTVDLARGKGAHVLAVVNRRGSDLADKSHGVLYTSDGRDVEMSVASTKAFYCQVVGGYVLSLALADAGGLVDFAQSTEAVRLLRELGDLPRRMDEVLAGARDRIRAAAQLALPRRHWALVGSGPLRHAADEIRIKLSELCYKSIAVDTIEDKKHIDLSSEPLILVCAAGLTGAAASDAVKEVAIFRAHHAAPIVVCDRGETRFSDYALATVEVPPASPHIALLLNALVGHLFGYECARAIDGLGGALRRAREATEAALAEVRGRDREPSGFPLDSTRHRYRNALEPLAREVLDAVSRGRWNSAIDPDLSVRVVNALRLALGQLSMEEAYRALPSFSFEGVLELCLLELTRTIDALRRPIDAIKHQAKTVTVGISREAKTQALKGALADALVGAGADLARLIDADGAALAALGPAVLSVAGATVYSVSGLDPLGAPTAESRIEVHKKTGLAQKIRSRADKGAPLTGTKRKLVTAPRVHVGRGERDQRALVMVPLYDRGLVHGLALLHVEFVKSLATRERVRALKATGRYEDLRCAVTEVDLVWEDRYLDPVDVSELLTGSIERLAESIVRAVRPAGETASASSAT